jgi:hypothetical protein
MNYRERLAHLRTRLAMVRTSHFAFGAGCACGLSAGHIDTSSVDSTIANHLAEKYRTSGQKHLSGLFERQAGKEELATIISFLSDGSDSLDDADAAVLCEDLETAIASLEELTGGKNRPKSRFESL